MVWPQDLGFEDDAMGVWVSDPISQLCADRSPLATLSALASRGRGLMARWVGRCSTGGAEMPVVAELREVKHGKIHMTVKYG